MNPDNVKWYVLHTYSGYENMVKVNLEMVFMKNNLMDRLVEINIPMEDVVEEKNGKRKIVQRKKFPCYVLIKMDYDNSMWHIITNTRGVTGFVGPQGRPLPLTDEEVKRMRIEKVVSDTDFKEGDKVKVTDGALEGFVGTIESIDLANSKCKLSVSMFGRITPVELELYQIERAE
ncbi:MAG: transcription termination/antitermination factor NusG [Clostridia bacterium]|jgi:transcriptional antiterminator NusG|nr:transcription termination/antitermination factor NusG [Clostridia bacterium]